jgi:hypothetical protein
MKRSLTVLPAVFFLSLVPASLAANCVAAKLQSPDPIPTIRQQYAAINKRLAKYKKVKKKLSGFSLEGGEMTAYFDGQAIVKIVANHYGEGGRSYEEYYYWQGKLIFVFGKDSRYDKPLSGKVVRTAESRCYFENDRLIRWIDEKGKQVPPGTAEYPEKQDEYLQTSSKFLDGARSKNAVIESE